MDKFDTYNRVDNLKAPKSWLKVLKKIFSNNQDTEHCAFCSGELETMTRPLILSGPYLAMTGIKNGDTFITYDEEGETGHKGEWVSITNQCYVCHHCKVFEKNHHKHIELASEYQILDAKKKLSASR